MKASRKPDSSPSKGSKATAFVSSADPIPHARLVIGFVKTMVDVLSVEEGVTGSTLNSVAAGFIDGLSVILSSMPTAATPAGRQALVQGVAGELEQLIAAVLADPARSASLLTIPQGPVQ